MPVTKSSDRHKLMAGPYQPSTGLRQNSITGFISGAIYLNLKSFRTDILP